MLAKADSIRHVDVKFATEPIGYGVARGSVRQFTQAVRADEANFLDPARFRFMLVRDKIFR